MRSSSVPLLRHPASPGASLPLAIDARCTVDADGALEVVVVPAAGDATRVDGLWRHTCCEVFVGHAGGPDYLEFNLAPSGAWAAYGFAAYRTPQPVPPLAAPSITMTHAPGELELRARLDPALWACLEGPVTTLHVGLTAVIEGRDGALSYYALRHPLEQADFHDARGFALHLERPAPPPRPGAGR